MAGVLNHLLSNKTILHYSTAIVFLIGYLNIFNFFTNRRFKFIAKIFQKWLEIEVSKFKGAIRKQDQNATRYDSILQWLWMENGLMVNY